MTKKDLIKFLNILGVRYKLDDFRKEYIKNIFIECPFAKWTHERGVDSRLNNASIRVKELPHLFHCFACKEGSGTLTRMVDTLNRHGMSKEKCDKLLELVDDDDELEFGILDALEDSKPTKEFDTSLMDKYSEPSQAIYDYLSYRNVSYHVVDKYGIKQDRNYMAIPMKSSCGEIVGVAKRLAIGEFGKRWRYEVTSCKELCLFGEQFVRGGDDAFLVEGQIDVLYTDNLIEGVLPLGANGSDLSACQIETLKRLGSLTLLVDRDKGGKFLEDKAIIKLYKDVPMLFKAELSKEGDDPAEVPKETIIESFKNRNVVEKKDFDDALKRRRKKHGKKLVGRRNP